MEEKKYVMPDSGCIDWFGEAPTNLPKPRIIKCSKKNANDAPIEVRRTIRPGFRRLAPGESIDWRKEYC